MARGKTLLTVVLALLIPAAAFVALRYRRYAYALAWHCRHGNYATFPGHRIKLPLTWWEEKDTVLWEHYFLKGACTGAVCLEPEIEVTRVVPLQEAFIPDSDQAEMEEQEHAITRWNENELQGLPLTLSDSLVKLGTRHNTLFCEKRSLRIGRIEANPSLDCGAARFPYTIMTLAWGPPAREQQVESILSTLE
jgi:hypothetical protein